VPPDVFIAAAEENGLVVALGDLIFDLVAADAVHLRNAADDPFDIAVNISGKQLGSPSFVEKVEETLELMSGMGLVLELTEHEFVNNDPVALDAMAQLSNRGVPFAIDDFGIGFSSIGYLQRLPVKRLKINKSFSVNIDRDERSCGLLRSIVMMGQALGLDVVTEGIERDSQLEHLREHVGATFAQGYLLNRPMPLDDVVEVIRSNRIDLGAGAEVFAVKLSLGS